MYLQTVNYVDVELHPISYSFVRRGIQRFDERCAESDKRKRMLLRFRNSILQKYKNVGPLECGSKLCSLHAFGFWTDAAPVSAGAPRG
jgi:hypothetical protein